ncbi:MAG: biopolymer transporter ExbD, partial [candidate division Zixibacteria bacterium]
MARKKRRISIFIDMTPMVDIAFLLLIFYMATTQFKPPEKEHVSLPASTSEFHVPNLDLINITVNKGDEIFLEYITNFTATSDTMIEGNLLPKDSSTIIRDYVEVDARTLTAEFIRVQAKFLRKGVLNYLVMVKADKKARYGTVKKVMNALQDIKIDRFSLMTEIRRQP